jgi:hypothetical protein
VDLVLVDDKNYKPVWGVEIKWSDRFFNKPKELKSLKSFSTENNLDAAVVTTINKAGVQELENLKLTFIPASIYTYNVGQNTLQQKTT